MPFLGVPGIYLRQPAKHPAVQLTLHVQLQLTQLTLYGTDTLLPKQLFLCHLATTQPHWTPGTASKWEG